MVGPARSRGSRTALLYLRCYAWVMSSSESPDKFEERKALTELRAKLVALVGVEKTEAIHQKAVSEASLGGEEDQAAVLAAMQRAYDEEVNRDPRTH